MDFIYNPFPLLNKAYELLLCNRPYKTEIRNCDCYTQDCKGKFLTKTDSDQIVCFQEMHRICYKEKRIPVIELIEERITI